MLSAFFDNIKRNFNMARANFGVSLIDIVARFQREPYYRYSMPGARFGRENDD